MAKQKRRLVVLRARALPLSKYSCSSRPALISLAPCFVGLPGLARARAQAVHTKHFLSFAKKVYL